MDKFDFKEFYDHQQDYAAYRDDLAKRNEYNIAVNWKVRNLCRLIPENKEFSDVLEIGCAMGILLNKVADELAVKHRIGLDISAENIKLAKTLFPECIFIQGTLEDAESGLLKDKQEKRFDVIILSDIIEHLPDDLDFLKKVSKISGNVLLNLPLEKCYMTRNRKYGVDDPSGHMRSYDEYDALRLVKSAGFEVITSFTANAHYDKEYFHLYRNNRKERVMKKDFFKKSFWTLYYSVEDIIRTLTPGIYIRLFGSNYFALLKPVNK